MSKYTGVFKYPWGRALFLSSKENSVSQTFTPDIRRTIKDYLQTPSEERFKEKVYVCPLEFIE